MPIRLPTEEFELPIDTRKAAIPLTDAVYKNLFEATSASLLLVHPKSGAILDANRSACAFYGHEKSRLTTLNLSDLEAFDGDALRMAAVAPRRKTPQTFDHRRRLSGGGHQTIEFTLGPVRVNGRDLVYVMGHDVTDSRAAEEENRALSEQLRQTSSTLEAILNAIPDVIGVQDLHHNILRFNRSGCDFFNIAPEDAAGRRCYELLGRKRPCRSCAAVEVLRTKQAARVEKYLEDRNIWIDTRAYPVFDDTGRLSGIVEHIRDISREKTAEAALKSSHERFVTVMDAMDVHVCVTDLSTHEILFMNRRMKADFDDDAVGKKCHVVFRHSSTPCPDCRNQALIDLNRNASAEPLEWESKSPVTGRHYLHYGRAILWTDGRTVRLHIASDISRLKAYEEEWQTLQNQLLHSRKMEAVGTLAGGIAHEFNNLMMAIQGHTSLMAIDIDASHAHFQHLKGIESCLDTSKDLTKQLLGVYRSGKFTLRPTPLNDIVDQCAQIFGGTRKKIKILKRYAPDLWETSMDRKQIRQVILNLYVNAWQAMPEGGRLTITTENVVPDEKFCVYHDIQPGRFVKCSVADNGIGMEPATLARIFDPFFTTKGMGRGTGLGLSSVYGIIRSHRGAITVMSEIGIGTTFSILLPALPQE